MKNGNSEIEDDLRPEYDLNALKVRRFGADRKKLGRAIVQLEPDVAEMFPNAEAVNEALRFLVRVMQNHQASAPNQSPASEPLATSEQSIETI